MLHLDYVSCLLTVLSTWMVGKRMWHGWIVAGANSAIIMVIGLRTGQWGFIPANIFCMAIYIYNISSWRTPTQEDKLSPTVAASDRLIGQTDVLARDPSPFHKARRLARVQHKHAATKHGVNKNSIDERIVRDRIRPRPVPDYRESSTPL
jgi:hypothetical protein